MAHDFSGGDPWAGLKEGMGSVNETLDQLAKGQRQKMIDSQNSALAALAMEKGHLDIKKEGMQVSTGEAQMQALMKSTGTTNMADALAKQAEIQQKKAAAQEDQGLLKNMYSIIETAKKAATGTPEEQQAFLTPVSTIVASLANTFNDPTAKGAFGGDFKITPNGVETTMLITGKEGFKDPITHEPLPPGTEYKLHFAGMPKPGEVLQPIKADYVKSVEPKESANLDVRKVDLLKKKAIGTITPAENAELGIIDKVERDQDARKAQNTRVSASIHEASGERKEARKAKITDLQLGNVNKPLSGGLETLAQKIANGTMSPSQLPKRQGTYTLILARAATINPNLDIREQDINTKLMGSSNFRQKIIGTESMDGILQSMVNAGKKVNFSHLKIAGMAEKWAKGQVNDPQLVEYMTLRNDALLSVASIMRGVGATDQAHRVEIEAASPTLDPPALDAWLRAQRVSLAPRLRQYQRIESKSGGGQSGKLGKYTYTVE